MTNQSQRSHRGSSSHSACAKHINGVNNDRVQGYEKIQVVFVKIYPEIVDQCSLNLKTIDIPHQSELILYA